MDMHEAGEIKNPTHDIIFDMMQRWSLYLYMYTLFTGGVPVQ